MEETQGEIRSRNSNLLKIAITTPKLITRSVQQREVFLPANKVFSTEGPPGSTRCGCQRSQKLVIGEFPQLSFFPLLPVWKEKAMESRDIIKTQKLSRLNKGLCYQNADCTVPVPGLSLGGSGGTAGLFLGAVWQHGPSPGPTHSLSVSQAAKMVKYFQPWLVPAETVPPAVWRWYRTDSAPPPFSVTMTRTYSRSRKALQNRAKWENALLWHWAQCVPKSSSWLSSAVQNEGLGEHLCLPESLRHLLYLSFLCPWLLFFFFSSECSLLWLVGEGVIFNLISNLYQIVFTMKYTET